MLDLRGQAPASARSTLAVTSPTSKGCQDREGAGGSPALQPPRFPASSSVVGLVTGEADFAPLALQLRRRGIRVEAASVAQNLGAELKTSVNEAIDLRGGGGEWRRSVGGRVAPLLAAFEPLA